MYEPLVDRENAERTWDLLASGSFQPASLRPVRLNGGVEFLVVEPPDGREFQPGVYLHTGLSFYAWPRLRAYRHRFVLVPQENVAGGDRWQLRQRDALDWIVWSRHMDHVVTFSTLKSGASTPWSIHAQSFPWKSKDREEGDVFLTALNYPGIEGNLRPEIEFGQMPQFERLRIETLDGTYPARAVRITYNNPEEGPLQAARKIFELAANHNAFTAFNVVIVPQQQKIEGCDELQPAIFFFPRRKDGRAIYQMNGRRWQIAALEMNGLMQVRGAAEQQQMDGRRIQDIFRVISAGSEWEEFLELTQTF